MQPRTQAILLVDDERIVLTFLETVLRSAGYIVYTACHAEHALEVLHSPAQIDVLVTDVIMPGIDGPALAAEILRLRPDFPILLSTGYGARLTAEMAKSLGIRELLTKPNDLESLGQAVQNALETKSHGI